MGMAKDLICLLREYFLCSKVVAAVAYMLSFNQQRHKQSVSRSCVRCLASKKMKVERIFRGEESPASTVSLDDGLTTDEPLGSLATNACFYLFCPR